jgi:hypothetical protein
VWLQKPYGLNLLGGKKSFRLSMIDKHGVQLMENTILDAVNDVGCVATGEALKRFDTDGLPIIREGFYFMQFKTYYGKK